MNTGTNRPGFPSASIVIKMNDPNLIASLGVSLLLIAFFLNVFRWIAESSWIYILLNIAGAGIACYASILIHFTPFIILEGTWAAVACAGLLKKLRNPAV